MSTFFGTAGDDTFGGTVGPDSFVMYDGGNDSVSGGLGDDLFNFGGALNRYDFVGGQSGYDVLTLTSGGDDMSNSMTGIEEIDFSNFAGAQNFAIHLGAPNLSAGQTLKIDGHGLTSGDTMFASGYTGAGGAAVCNLVILGGACWNGLLGGSGNDDLDVSHSSTQISGGVTSYAYGYGGNDVIRVGNTLPWLYAVDGGTGDDTMTLSGTAFSDPIDLGKVTGIETIILAAYYGYNLVPGNGTVAAGANLTVDASALDVNHSLGWDGSSETDGSFTITGGSGNDDITGGAQRDVIRTGGGYDYIDLQWGGNDFVESGADDDIIIFGAGLTAGDHADGGDGYDVVRLAGDYAAGLTFASTTVINTEVIVLGAGHSYNLTLDAATIGPMIIGDGYGYGLYVKGDSLGSGDTMRVDASAEAASTGVRLRGGQGANTLIGGAGPDQLYITASIVNTNQVFGGAGDDMIEVDAGFGSSDKIDGGPGSDTLTFYGSVSIGFLPTTVTNVEIFAFFEAASVDNSFVVTSNTTVAAGATLLVDASSLSDPASSLAFNGAAETDGNFHMLGSAGGDLLTGGAKNDVFELASGGADNTGGAAGADLFNMGSALTAADRLAGGSGMDTATLDGDYGGGVVFAAATLNTIEVLQLAGGHSYKLTAHNGNLAAGETLTVDGSALLAGNVLDFSGAAETKGHFIFKSGLGGDKLTGGAAADRFVYSAVAQSTSTHFDTIGGFDFKEDHFDLAAAVTGVDATVATGTLRSGHFDTNLASAVNNAHLAKDHAVLFTPDSGNYAGRTFVVVDINGHAGYQAGQDLVIRLDGATHLGSLNAGDFI